jgi:hypothetical protein
MVSSPDLPVYSALAPWFRYLSALPRGAVTRFLCRRERMRRCQIAAESQSFRQGTTTWPNGMMVVIASPAVDRSTHMGEVVRFIPKSELERVRLIREARAIYDSIFPPADSGREPRDARK